MTNPPSISVVMPVRNALPYLDEAVASILDQSFADFEFVIGDDASTDGSTERLREWAERDPRIRLFEQPGPALGPAASSDWVARLARAPLVARMDADDVSRCDRLERQLAAIASDPEIVLVGSLWEGIDAGGRVVHGRDRSTLLAPGKRPFLHSILYRRDAFERAGGYRAGCDYWEDDDLFRRLADQGRTVVLPQPLYRYRWSPGSSRFGPGAERVEDAMQLSVVSNAGQADAALIERWRAEIPGRRIDPAIYLGFAFPRIWSGRRAGILRRLLRRGQLRGDPRAARLVLWAALASLAPRLLRLILRIRMERRDQAAARIVADDRLYDWRPVLRPHFDPDAALRYSE